MDFVKIDSSSWILSVDDDKFLIGFNGILSLERRSLSPLETRGSNKCLKKPFAVCDTSAA